MKVRHCRRSVGAEERPVICPFSGAVRYDSSPFLMNKHLAGCLERGEPEAEQIFARMVVFGSADRQTFSMMMKSYTTMQQTSKALAVLDLAMERGMAEEFMYCMALKIYGEARDIHNARLLFTHVIHEGIQSPVIFTQMIILEGKYGDKTSTFRELFDTAVAISIADRKLYHETIRSYVSAREYGRAIDILRMAVKANEIYSESFNHLAHVLMSNNLLSDAENVYHMSVTSGCDDPKVVCALMNIYARRRNVRKVREFFDGVKERGKLTSFEYSIMIKAYGICHSPHEAMQIFEEAKQAGVANIVVYRTIASAIRVAGQVEEAERLFEEAIRMGLTAEMASLA